MSYPIIERFLENGLHKSDLPASVTAGEFVRYYQSQGRVPDRDHPKSLIVCYQDFLYEFIKRRERGKYRTEKYFKRKLLVLDRTDGQVAVAGNLGIGPAGAAYLMEMMFELGLERVINIGTAGSLHPDLLPGDIFVADKAIRDDGLSHHYIQDSQYALSHPILRKKLENGFGTLNVPISTGDVWTTIAILRESQYEVDTFSKDGVLGVEMEDAGLFAVSQFFGKECAAAHIVSDQFVGGLWVPNSVSDRVIKRSPLLYEAALLAAQSG